MVCLNHLVKVVILFASQEAKTTDSFTTVTNLTCGIYCGFVIVNTLAIAQRDKGFVPVCGGRCFAVRAEPAI